MKRIRLFIASLALLLGIGGMVPVVALAASPEQAVCSTLGSKPDCSQTPANSVSLNKVIKATINLLSFTVGLVAVIMIMVSGYKYVTAGGDSNKVSNAKNTLVYALIGLVIAALAQGLVKFVLTKVK